MRDPLDTLRNLRDMERDTVGARPIDLAHFSVVPIDEVQADLDRYQRDRLVTMEIEPMGGSRWYDVSDDGMATLREADAAKIAAPPTERLL